MPAHRVALGVLVAFLALSALAGSLVLPHDAGLVAAPTDACTGTARNGLALTLGFDAPVTPGDAVNATVRAHNPTDVPAAHRVSSLRVETFEVLTASTWRSVGGYVVTWDFTAESVPPRLAPGESVIVHAFTAGGPDPLLPGAFVVRAHLLGACVEGAFTVAHA